MRLMILIAAGAIAGLGLFASPGAHAQSSWSDVSCEGAGVSLAPGFRCRRSSEFRYPDNTTGQSDAVVGEVNGFSVSISLMRKQGNFPFYGAGESERLARGYVANAKAPIYNASRFTPSGNGGYLTFTRENKACVGFDSPVGKYVSQHTGGTYFSYVIRGYFCSNHPLGNPQQEAINVLAALKIGGPGHGKNPFGEAPRPHPRFPQGHHAQTGGPSPAANAARLEADLATAKSLYDKRLITKDEYDAKRQAILSRM